MYACGWASRRALSAGSVRMKSPIAPPRITRMRFIGCPRIGSARWKHALPLILRKRERENHTAIDQGDSVQTAPAKDATRAPVDLIAKDIRDRDPKQPGSNQQISEHRYQQSARFVAQKGCIEQRLRRKQTQNSKGAYREKFVHETQHEHVTDWQCNEQWAPETGEFAHLNRSDQPKRPSETDGEQNNSRSLRTRKPLYDTREVRLQQSEQTD